MHKNSCIEMEQTKSEYLYETAKHLPICMQILSEWCAKIPKLYEREEISEEVFTAFVDKVRYCEQNDCLFLLDLAAQIELTMFTGSELK